MISLLFFSASSRKGSDNSRLVTAAANLVKSSYTDDVSITLANLADYDIPTYTGGNVTGTHVPKQAAMFSALLRRHDGVFMGADEYTGSYSAILRNIVGWLVCENGSQNTAFDNKPVVICGASSRGFGSLRGHPALHQLLSSLGAKVHSQHLRLGTSISAFDSDGKLTAGSQRQLLEYALPILIKAAKAETTTEVCAEKSNRLA